MNSKERAVLLKTFENMDVPKVRNKCDIKGIVDAYEQLNEVNNCIKTIIDCLLKPKDDELNWLYEEKMQESLSALVQIQSDIQQQL